MASSSLGATTAQPSPAQDRESRLQPDNCHNRLMNFEHYTRTSPDRSPGFSQIRLSQQYAAALANIHRLKPGLQEWYIRVIAQNS
ncbi:MAG: hypothetical protein ACLFVO_20375 [Chloroflexaceae bacterium]